MTRMKLNLKIEDTRMLKNQKVKTRRKNHLLKTTILLLNKNLKVQLLSLIKQTVKINIILVKLMNTFLKKKIRREYLHRLVNLLIILQLLLNQTKSLKMIRKVTIAMKMPKIKQKMKQNQLLKKKRIKAKKKPTSKIKKQMIRRINLMIQLNY